MSNHPGWFLLLAGLILAGIGLVWLLAPSVPWLGRLPGDVVIERQRTRFYFPITTCVALSVLLTALVWVIRYLSR